MSGFASSSVAVRFSLSGFRGQGLRLSCASDLSEPRNELPKPISQVGSSELGALGFRLEIGNPKL